MCACRSHSLWIPLFTVATLVLVACGKPRYDIKDPVRTVPTGQQRPAPQFPEGGPIVPTLPQEPMDCSARGLTQAGIARYGVDAFAKTFKKREVKGSSIRGLFSAKSGRVIARGLRYADISVAPRDCTRGYPAPHAGKRNGNVIADRKGKMISEFLALGFEGFIAVDDDTRGLYQFSLLADDGALLEIFIGGRWQTLVDNDGFHSVRLKCSENMVALNEKGLLPFRLYYYQGPRLHIANMLLWKKVESFSADPACGREGQRLFFDPKTSAPKAPFLEFLERGWVTVPPANLIVHAKKHAQHPCFLPGPPAVRE